MSEVLANDANFFSLLVSTADFGFSIGDFGLQIFDFGLAA
jgi:hypothetical protein